MPLTVSEIAAVGCGGAAGAICRFALQALWAVESRMSLMAVNLIGCLLIGVVWGVAERCGAPRWATLFCATGFLGGFTTFSSFSFDTVTLLRSGQTASALLYAGVTTIAGIALTFCSYSLLTRH